MIFLVEVANHTSAVAPRGSYICKISGLVVGFIMWSNYRDLASFIMYKDAKHFVAERWCIGHQPEFDVVKREKWKDANMVPCHERAKWHWVLFHSLSGRERKAGPFTTTCYFSTHFKNAGLKAWPWTASLKTIIYTVRVDLKLTSGRICSILIFTYTSGR